MNNAFYWRQAKNRAEIAKRHTNEMASLYQHQIDDAIKNTKVHDSSNTQFSVFTQHTPVNVSIMRTDSVSAIFSRPQVERICVLNFASFKEPGGRFLQGSRAQEESLCHESFLYNVLAAFPEYYEENKKRLTKGLYDHRALYSQGIYFIRDNETRICDVVTCAAPNFSVAKKFVTQEQNDNEMKWRINFILSICDLYPIDTLILGAWGCGVFQQNPATVAQLFKDGLETICGWKTKCNVIFAIPNQMEGQPDNAKAFEDVFNQKKKE